MNIYISSGIAAVLLLNSIVTPAISCDCQLRTDPLPAFGDGLRLQVQLLANKHQEFSLLPNMLVLKEDLSNEPQIHLVKKLLNLIKERESLENLWQSTTTAVMKHIMNSVISDSCAYLESLLGESIDCSSTLTIESLASKLELQAIMDSLFSKFSSEAEFVGSDKNRQAYWNEHVVKQCTPRTCPRLRDIERLLRFRPNSDKCNCL